MRHSLDFLPGLLTDNSVAIIFGPSQSGKTFVALHALCSAALGRSWFGSETETKRRVGLYLALEGEAGIKARIKAWCAAHGVEANPIHYRLGAFRLTDEDDVAELIAYMKKHGVEFVIIDTLSLAMAGLDENAGQHMTHVMEVLHNIKDETKACVAVTAHTGKVVSRGERGHSSQRANVDHSIEVVTLNKETVNGKTIERPVTLATPRCIVVRKARDGQSDTTWRFRLELQATDVVDARGRVVSSPALIEPSAAEKFGDLDATAREEPSGDPLADSVLGRLIENQRLIGGSGVTSVEYRDALKRTGWRKDAKPAAWRKAWQRYVETLVIDSSGEIET